MPELKQTAADERERCLAVLDKLRASYERMAGPIIPGQFRADPLSEGATFALYRAMQEIGGDAAVSHIDTADREG